MVLVWATSEGWKVSTSRISINPLGLYPFPEVFSQFSFKSVYITIVGVNLEIYVYITWKFNFNYSFFLMASGKTLPQAHIITPPSPSPFPHKHKSSSPSSRKGVRNYLNLQILKVSPPGLILDIGPFWFCCIFKLQELYHCTLFRGVAFPICLIFTYIYPF